MRTEAIIKFTANDCIDYARENYDIGLLASEITSILEYIEQKHDCNLTYWENLERAIVEIKAKVLEAKQ